MDFILHAGTITVGIHLAIFVAVSVRVIMLRPATGIALAWILICAVLPIVGGLLYVLFGERRVGQRRARRIAALRPDLEGLASVAIQEGMTDVDWARHREACRAMDRLGRSMVGMPTVVENGLELISDTQTALRRITEDVDRAEHSVHMEFYIWSEGGAADDVLEALIRAAGRGIVCRVLVDSLGSRPWLKGKQPKRLRKAGVEVVQALPVGLLRTVTARNDLRIHRKIVAIDGRVAWTGSMNLVDPRLFKQGAGVGQWVDAMVRVEGNAVGLLVATLIYDWQLETGAPVHDLLRSADVERVRGKGTADVQVIPSGPEESGDGILQMLIATIYAAREKIVLTTPYFIPDESMLRALRGAAARGVEVDLIVPERVDSMLVRHASRSYYADLMEAGIRIRLFRSGLLHTKSITVDDRLSMIGTVNLDMRSLWLNYEVSLFVYDADFTKRLRALQQTYLDDSDGIDLGTWLARPFGPRFMENMIRLVGPLL